MKLNPRHKAVQHAGIPRGSSLAREDQSGPCLRLGAFRHASAHSLHNRALREGSEAMAAEGLEQLPCLGKVGHRCTAEGGAGHDSAGCICACLVIEL